MRDYQSLLKNHWSQEHLVQFFETDAMGVVHHSNYLRVFEEARVLWLKSKGLEVYHYPQGNLILAVIETRVRHFYSARFLDSLRTLVMVKREKLKIVLRYATFCQTSERLLALGDTVLVPVGTDLKPQRWPQSWEQALSEEVWTETWPWNL